MENKIAVASLASLLAQSTGKSKKLCEDFLREFFRLTAETLENGETLKIKGFGTFKVNDVESRNSVNVNTGEPFEIASHKKVVFTPAKELASAINAPFEDFESVEMDDDVPEDIFLEDTGKMENSRNLDDETPKFEEAQNEEISDEDTVSVGRLEEGSNEEGEDDDITYEAYTEAASISTNDSTTEIPVSDDSDHSQYPEVEEYPQRSKSRFGIGFLTGALCTFAVCAIIFMLGCFFDWWPVNFGNPKNIISATQQAEVPQEEIQLPEEEPVAEKEPVYDTVSTTRYLTTISREHYGNYNFWPYIYLENESILGHPDRITPGTKVVVPDLAKYGVDPTNKEDVAKAKQKAVEIYARFK